MKQTDLFGDETNKMQDSSYTSKIKTPVYRPRVVKPHINELFDISKTNRIVSRIKSSNITDEEKAFLIKAAQRHTVFNYENIADYYANSSPEMQRLMEENALVIVDFDKAYECGFVQLAHDLANNFFDCYE
tara:strand:+ start:1467 stop:1859 length:393 start_codon:yes stop_codon:yes gene_type:complete